MTRNQENWLIGILLMILACIISFIGYLVFFNGGQKIVDIVSVQPSATATPTMMVPQATYTQQVIEVMVTPTPVPSPTPDVLTPTPVMNGYNFGGIDLSSGLPTALTFILPDGTVITSPWNRAIAYKEGDDYESIFGPGAGTIYTHTRDLVITWLHSGTWNGQTIFATDLERYVRLDGARILSYEESQARVKNLTTANAFLCQLSTMDTANQICWPGNSDYTGKIVQLEVVAGAVIPHDMVQEYEDLTGYTREWLANYYPDAGFIEMTKENHWLIKTCVGILNGQSPDGTPTYLFNRLALGFKVKQ